MRMRCFPIVLPVCYAALTVCFPPSSPKPVQIEPALPTDTSSFPCIRSSSHGPMENSMEDPASAGTELAGLSPEAGDVNNLPINSHPGPGSRACSGNPEDGFSNFLYWRTPLPDISKDLELLLSEAGLQEEACSRPESMHNSCVARSEIQKVLDSLQEHLMSDPDVQGKPRRRNHRAGAPGGASAGPAVLRACVCFPSFASCTCGGQALRVSLCRYLQGFCPSFCSRAGVKSVLIQKQTALGLLCPSGNCISSSDTV